jgi:hypothetical protein
LLLVLILVEPIHKFVAIDAVPLTFNVPTLSVVIFAVVEFNVGSVADPDEFINHDKAALVTLICPNTLNTL